MEVRGESGSLRTSTSWSMSQMLRRATAADLRPGTGTKSRKSMLRVSTSCATSPVVPSTDAAARATR